MSRRKRLNKALSYYLCLADRGDKDAEEMVRRLGAEMSKKDERRNANAPICVTYSDGSRVVYNGYRAVMRRCNIKQKELTRCLEYKDVDEHGRRYEYVNDLEEEE